MVKNKNSVDRFLRTEVRLKIKLGFQTFQNDKSYTQYLFLNNFVIYMTKFGLQ